MHVADAIHLTQYSVHAGAEQPFTITLHNSGAVPVTHVTLSLCSLVDHTARHWTLAHNTPHQPAAFDAFCFSTGDVSTQLPLAPHTTLTLPVIIDTRTRGAAGRGCCCSAGM